jgi:group I intron endonuclease
MYLPPNVNTNCGVYRIKNMRNGKFYIGSSKNLKGRWKTHKRQLNKGRHHCDTLQDAWNSEADTSVFVFEPFIFCREKLLRKIEQGCLDFMRPFYNVSKTADRPGDNPATWAKISKANSGERGPGVKLSKEQALEILNSPLPQREISKIYGVSVSAIYGLRNGKTWKNLPRPSDELIATWKENAHPKSEEHHFFGKRGDNAVGYGRCGEQHPNFGKKFPKHSARMTGDKNPMMTQTPEQRRAKALKAWETRRKKDTTLLAEAHIPSDWPSEVDNSPEASASPKVEIL